MTGSLTGGEDVVPNALFEAYRNLDQFDDTRPLSPRLFRIAHNRCIDFLRHRGVRTEAEANAVEREAEMPREPAALGIGKAFEHLVLTLPPKERACVLLKDVFDYSLEDLVDSTVGGVKAALSRRRSKLAAPPAPVKSARTANPELTRGLYLHVERFNRHDWGGLRELIAEDARLQVADRFLGPLDESPYFGNYERWTFPWRLAMGEVDGEPVVVVLNRETGQSRGVVRLSFAAGHITHISDDLHCPWIVQMATPVVIDQSGSK
jgi:RNA polymerase sigma-70 factor (ECF subfamily)